jgi:hypothetical protein
MGWLLQENTMDATGPGNNSNESSQTMGIKTEYKCLVQVQVPVRVNQDSQDAIFQQKGLGIPHYTDPKSPAPKPFATEPKKGWLRCAMCIIEIGSLQTWKGDDKKGEGQAPIFFREVKVELLTGRTHQIRGQYAAINLPLVGGSLSGSVTSAISWDEARNRGITSYNPASKHPLALQCCSISFPKPQWGKHPRTKRSMLILGESRQRCCFPLDKPWWSNLVN